MDLRIWVEGTVVAAMAMALSFLPIEFANSGLDLSLGMVPLVLYSFRRGLLPGVAAGFVWGMLNIILGTAMKNFLSVPQIIFEYPFAFAFGGMGGVFARKIQLYFQANRLKSAIRTIILGSVVAVFAPLVLAFLGGCIGLGHVCTRRNEPISLFLCSKRYKYRRQLFVCKSSSRLIGKSSTAIICS